MQTRNVWRKSAPGSVLTVGAHWLVRCVLLALMLLWNASSTAIAFAGQPESPQRPSAPPPSEASNARSSKSPVDPFSDPEADLTLGASDTRSSDTYGERIQSLRSDVDALKDKVFRSKARLALLRETVLRGVMSGSRVILSHRNLMGTGFRLVRVVYRLDGAQIFARTDETGSLNAEDELVVFDGNLSAGPHEVEIELSYTGHGYGVFSYLTEYTFESKSRHAFTAPEDGAVKVLSVGYEEGNMTTEMADRPNVSWQITPLDGSGRPLPKRTRDPTKSPKKKSVR